jgi:hypothetical protein
MASQDGTLYHLAPLAAWSAAKASGTPYTPATYEQVRTARAARRKCGRDAACEALSRSQLHVLRRGAWHARRGRALRGSQSVRAPKADACPRRVAAAPQDGFVHLTLDPDALIPIANHFYKGATAGRARSHENAAAELTENGAASPRARPACTRAAAARC